MTKDRFWFYISFVSLICQMYLNIQNIRISTDLIGCSNFYILLLMTACFPFLQCLYDRFSPSGYGRLWSLAPTVMATLTVPIFVPIVLLPAQVVHAFILLQDGGSDTVLRSDPMLLVVALLVGIVTGPAVWLIIFKN